MPLRFILVLVVILLLVAGPPTFAAQPSPVGETPSTDPATSSILGNSLWLNCNVMPADVARWKSEIDGTSQNPEQRAQLHVWLGEYALAHNLDPDAAKWHLRQAQSLVAKTDTLFGLAAYDTALCDYKQGAFATAADEFAALMTPPTALRGYDLRDCAAWMRRAGAAAGYHADHAALGIMEHARLNPCCAAAALAACLNGLGLNASENRVLSAVRVTGEGSTLQDLIDAGPKLGVSVKQVTCNDTGLVALPKPLIAHVEHDHFVAVVHADSSGVSYLCADQGAWQGVPMKLSWKQWHAMEPDVCATVTQPNSPWDRIMQALAEHRRPGISVASLGDVSLVGETALESKLLSGVAIDTQAPGAAQCGLAPSVNRGHAQSNPPTHTGGSGKPGSPIHVDPVNLASGEEDYVADPDLSVYNPNGPSVTWTREYHSLRTPDPLYTYDYGTGWSQAYNVGISDGALPTVGTGSKMLIYSNGLGIAITAPSVPSASNPTVACTVELGAAVAVNWVYDVSSAAGDYLVSFPNRTQWTLKNLASVSKGYLLTRITNRDGKSIDFHYDTVSNAYGYPLVSSVTDTTSGTTLLTVNRATDGIGNVVSISDCYGRSVYYHEDTTYNENVGYQFTQYQQALEYASQIVATGTSNPPHKANYEYELVSDGEGSESIEFLHTISVPSATTSGGWATFTIDYNGYDFVKDVIDSENNESTFAAVDANGNSNYNDTTVTVTNSSGTTIRKYTVSYDSNYDLLTQTDDSDVASNLIVQKTYGGSLAPSPFKPSTVLDGMLRSTSYTYDSFGNVLTIKLPSGILTTNSYTYPATSPLGELGSVTVTSGSSSKTPTSYTYYDSTDGRIKDTIGPLPGSTGGPAYVLSTDTYDTLGNLTQLTRLGPNSTATTLATHNEATYTTTTFNYTSGYGGYTQAEALAEPLTVTTTGRTASGGSTTVSLFAGYSRGDLAASIDALGNETDTYYDYADNPVKLVYPATGQTGSGRGYVLNTYQYVGGPLSSVRTYDEGNNPTTPVREADYEYGSEAELTQELTNVTTPIVTYTYDGLYRVASVTDGDNTGTSHSTRYYYNLAGYLDTITYPGYSGPTPVYSGGTWGNVTGADSLRYPSYNLAGQPLTMTDGNGATTSFYYGNTDGLMTTENYSVVVSRDATYSYDAFDRLNGLTQATGGAGSKAFAYDDQDNLTSTATTFSAFTGAKTVSYGYDPDGSRASMTTPSGTTSYTYDGAARPYSLTDPYGGTTYWSYYNNSLLASQVLPDGVTATYSYNALGELKRLTNTTSTTTLSDFGGTAGIGYDAAQDPLTVPVTISSPTALSGSTTYGYDLRSELTSESSTRNGGYSEANFFDTSGNPTELRTVSGATYNTDNEQTTTSNVFDGNGNPTTYGTCSLTFDSDNELTKYVEPSGYTLTACYGADGQRWSKSFTGTGVTTYFLYDGANPVCEMNGSGTVNGTNVFGANGLICRGFGGAITYYTFDENGDVAQRTVSGTVTSSDVYDGFGNTASGDVFGYGGQYGCYTDHETGLIWCGHRYYDPTRARWVTRDPVGYVGGINLYGYCDDDPVGWDDPDGWGGRPSTASMRRAWERYYNKAWPRDPKTGRYQDVSHKVARADGGCDSPENIEPECHDAHVARHKANGDFKRWGKMRTAAAGEGAGGEGATATEAGGAVADGVAEGAAGDGLVDVIVGLITMLL